ncbi:hypothetical protein [Stenotrophomonas sp. C1657]|uniref:hypothetical protein n=1 Tax=Stenotrophomonas sp. C1657 TaxID=3077844 RepID=UPI00293D056F|nr:hypothetical protein [Stenotrophomonas sp. C1657]MDV3515164.1 hypothetical protein [Stenotrophomonas sp. C1657]
MGADAHELAAKFIGRAAAFEKALQVIIGSSNATADLLKTNLTMRRQHLGNDLANAGLPQDRMTELLPIATRAAVEAENSICKGLQGGKYFPLP